KYQPRAAVDGSSVRSCSIQQTITSLEEARDRAKPINHSHMMQNAIIRAILCDSENCACSHSPSPRGRSIEHAIAGLDHSACRVDAGLTRGFKTVQDHKTAAVAVHPKDGACAQNSAALSGPIQPPIGSPEEPPAGRCTVGF